MVVIDTVFKICQNFGLLSEEEYARNYQKAKDQWGKIEIADETVGKYNNFEKILQRVKRAEDNWFVCICIAVGQIFIIRAISEYLQPKGDEEGKNNLLNRFRI